MQEEINMFKTNLQYLFAFVEFYRNTTLSKKFFFLQEKHITDTKWNHLCGFYTYIVTPGGFEATLKTVVLCGLHVTTSGLFLYPLLQWGEFSDTFFVCFAAFCCIEVCPPVVSPHLLAHFSWQTIFSSSVLQCQETVEVTGCCFNTHLFHFLGQWGKRLL